MKVTWRQSAKDDVLRQFRYCLAVQDASEAAANFCLSLRQTIDTLLETWARHGPRLSAQQLALRSWPVAEFEKIRIYYVVHSRGLRVIRIIDGNPNVGLHLRSERAPG
jgi:plasmid stabilization system protein ParE